MTEAAEKDPTKEEGRNQSASNMQTQLGIGDDEEP